MPKKKKRQSRGKAPKNPAQRSRSLAEKRREEVLKGFSRWLSSTLTSGPGDAMVDDIRLLLDLKADQLESPDSTLWSAETTEILLTEVLPRKVVRERSDAMLFVPALGSFFEYLVDAGTWHRRSMTPNAAHQLLNALEFDVVEAMDDPTRRSFSGNIMNYAMENGIEFSGEEDLNRYMAWYNSLPQEERSELSDTGRLASPSVPFDPSVPAEAYPQPDLGEMGAGPGSGPAGTENPYGSDLDDEYDDELEDGELEEGAGPDWPWFLGDPPVSDEYSRAPFDDAQMQAEYESNEFVRRARILLDAVRDAPKLTATDALTLADSREVLSRFGVEASFRSMWEVPELVGPWLTLLDGEWIRLEGGRPRVAEGIAPVASPTFDPEGYADFAHALLSRALLSMAMRELRDGGFRGMPDILSALLQATRPEGVTLPAVDLSGGRYIDGPTPPVDPTTGRADIQEILRFEDVTADLNTLAAYGVIERDGLSFRAPTVLLQAMGVMMSMMMDSEG